MSLININLKRPVLAMIAALLIASGSTSVVLADSFDDQIKAAQQQIANFQDQIVQLKTQADTIQNAIDVLSAQQNALQVQIGQKQIELQQLQQQIQETQNKIDNQKIALGINLKSMYIEGDVTPLDIIASSKGISDFIDKQEYRDKIRNSIAQSLITIKALKADLDSKEIQAKQALADQTALSNQVASQQAEKDKLLADTQGNEATYQGLVAQNNSKISTLKAEQAAANARYLGSVGVGPTCGGGYPAQWCQIPQDTVSDNWGMYNRECVSYAAFRVAASGRHMPYWGGVGNANQWPDNARAQGIPVDSSPRVGDVAIWVYASANGHAMYVEAVDSSNGSIVISDYNYNGDGRYGGQRAISQATYQSQGFQFIHF